MNIFSFLYTEVLYKPLFNVLVWLYTTAPFADLGLAIIILTLFIRLLLAPLMWKAQTAQKRLSSLQPEVKRLQEAHKENKETQGKALMELYAEHNVNPFSGCVVMLIQIPILIALFRVFQLGFMASELQYLYSFVHNPGALNPISFGILDLSKGNLYLGAVAAITQFFQIKMSTPGPVAGQKKDFASMLQFQSLYLFPALILIWSYKLPAALALYWTVLNVFGIVQEIIMRRRASRSNQVRPVSQKNG